MITESTAEVGEPAPKCCRIDSAQDLLILLTACDGMGSQHNVTPEPEFPTHPPPPAMRRPIPHVDRPLKRARSENWRHTEEAPPPPPDQLVLDEQVPDPTLNVASLFCDENFKSALPNERGRGGLAAGALCLLERLRVAQGHVHAVRSGHHVDRWLLNRMPGRTDALLHFVNGMLAGMLGLKPFSSWRAMARSLGDSRDYLPARHWRCLELKGGGVNASAKQPWQAYRAVSGHFDRLADDLESCLLTRRGIVENSTSEGSKKRKGNKISRQLQLIAMRESLLAKGEGSGASSATGKPFESRAELAVALQADWNTILVAQNLIR